MTEQRAMEVLQKYTTKPNLIKHAVAVAETMRHFARLAGEDAQHWAIVGLLHDVDYELYPDCHCEKCVEILRDEGFDDSFIRSIQTHGYGICTDIAPTCYMEQILGAIDQLTGFIIACALMKPDKKLASVDMDSMKRRWKDKKFAGGTNRERIENICANLDGGFEYVISETLIAMQNVADKFGL